LTETPGQTADESGWARLRRRKVVQCAIAYLAGAWGCLQFLDFLSDTYGLSQGLRMVALPAMLAGLPIVLVLAWYHGDRGHQRVTRMEFGILTLLVALGATGVWRYYESIAARGLAPAAREQSPADGSAYPDLRPSVAVLPFENHSADPDDAYFVDGIQDDILTELTKVATLRVIASTSVEQLRGSTLPVQEIGRRLGVVKLLQGRVQRAGDRVRINVALIDAATGSQEWAERYDRSVTAANILAIQSGVAATVAARMQGGLQQASATAGAGPGGSTRNLAAWSAYHRGEKSKDPEEAEQLYRLAIEADPRFARAYVGLAESLVQQVYVRGARRDVVLPEAETAVETALQLEPGLSDAWLASASLFAGRGDQKEEEVRIRKAIELNPNHAAAYESLSDALDEQGRADEALQMARKAVALDPLSLGANLSLAGSLAKVDRLDEAEARYRQTVDLDPTSPAVLSQFANFEAYRRNRFAAAVKLRERAVALAPDNAGQVGELAGLLLDLEDYPRAAQLLDDARVRWPDRTNVNIYSAILACYQGDQLTAVRLAQKVVETQPRHYGALQILAEADIAKGDVAAARARWNLAYPEFFGGAAPVVDRGNYVVALEAASVLIAANERDRARVLLDGVERVLRGAPTSIDHVFLYLLRGDAAKARAALHEVVSKGWRGPL
jgi:TolB-like protein